VDQELITYLDGRFEELRAEMVGLRVELRDEISELRGEVGELRGEVAEFRDQMGGFRNEIGVLRSEIQTTAADSRRHFDVVAEDLRSMIQVVAEGVALSNEALERFRAEVNEQFRTVDRRLMRLEARASTA